MPANTRSLAAIQADEKQLRDRAARLVDEKRLIQTKIDIDGATDGLTQRLGSVENGIDNTRVELATLGEEHGAAIQRMVESGATRVEAGVNLSNAYTDRQDDTRTADVEPHRRAGLSDCMRVLERHQRDDSLTDRAVTTMEKLVRDRDPSGVTARYIAAAGAPDYATAFLKLLQYGTAASMRMSPAELGAVETVTRVESERAMDVGTGSAGGFAVPISIDPSINLTSSGAINPIRQLADVRQIVSDTLRLVSADTPASGYGAELAEQTDASPTLVQPTITVARGTTFIPVSIELTQDWGSIEGELMKLLSDGRDILDSTKMLSGSGTNEPVGIFGTGGLTTTQRIQSATTATLAIADAYSLRQGLSATRFWANATFVGHPTTWDAVWRLVGQGNTTEPLPFNNGRGGDFVGTNKREWSAMSTLTTTTGAKMLLLGDWSGYVIADRIGATVEVIPHLFGAANRYPIGARGFFYFWRTGTCVSKPNAFRYLELK
jgi:HK97 family phage major capsid protein